MLKAVALISVKGFIGVGLLLGMAAFDADTQQLGSRVSQTGTFYSVVLSARR